MKIWPQLGARLLVAIVLLVPLAAPKHAVAGPLEDGITAYEAGEYETARELLQRFVRRNRRSAEGQFQLGRTARALGDYKLAVRSFRRALRLDDTIKGARTQLGVTYLRCWCLRTGRTDAVSGGYGQQSSRAMVVPRARAASTGKIRLFTGVV